MTDEQASKIDYKNLIASIIGIALSIFGIAFLFVFMIIPMILSSKIAHLAKNPKNIRDDGCLMYASKSDKHGSLMFYLNQKGPYTLRQISIYPEKSSRKLGKLIDESGLSYHEFASIHSKECIKVRYVSGKFLWVSSADIYDFY
ncbi:hypothetical protein LP123_12900 [Moraxella bovis]|uniref:Uncharacterized protein n=1 Tax=Moraxella bovis TaxID=476 RepID=A0AAQ2Q2C4_MORBO|nr:hypothetical protein [Moraxella bovis]AWY19315.1 hypothetical protein DQF64_01430 [Moraxella bovis]UYZ76027.1 hypothetical protein LP093_01425 [Moraxella bovis]UYZ78020.1 hypothetical protein LP115_12370 [Moraxella bovis]UYZ80915.1 hypothetical protein LP113_13050 [Moraxella bovis]UYZ86506.1 hypothetical protein LP094_12420 [Moraxella bovis]